MKLTTRIHAPSLSPTDIMHVVLINDKSQSPQGSSYYTTIQEILALYSGVTMNSYWTAGTATNAIKTTTGNNTASGQFAIAMGQDTKATGYTSHAEGVLTIAGGIYSHAEGNQSKAFGEASHAGGYNTIAGGNFSFVHGNNSLANNINTIVLGANITGNTADTTYVDRLNIKNIQNGASVTNLGVDISGNVVSGTTGGGGGTTIKWYAENTNLPSILPTAVGVGSIAIGNNSQANNNDSFSFGNNSGYQSVNSNNSVFIGYLSGYQVSGSPFSICVGHQAGAASTGNTSSSFIGESAGYFARGSSTSNFIGKSAGYSASNSINCNFMGVQAGYASSGCTSCNFIGNAAAFQSDNLINCNFIGLGTGTNAHGSVNCNAIGSDAASNTSGSSYCNYFGHLAGYSAGTIAYCNLIGFQAGQGTITNRMGNNNIVIGTNISLPNATANAINLGGVLFGTGTYSSTVGNPSVVAQASGRIGINKVTPSYALDVVGNIAASADVIAYSSSDKRLKDNITKIENPLEKISKLNGYMFDWNNKQDTYTGHDVGIIAQEVEEVLPEVVTTREDGYKAVKYEKIIALLIEGINELQEEVKQLKTKLNG